jgi:hypothetical protein
MIILACLSSGVPTPLDTSVWVPDKSYFDSCSWAFEPWANRTVYLLASIHNFLCKSRPVADVGHLDALKAEWASLWDALTQHELERPPVCQPIAILPPEAGDEKPFEMLYYVNGLVGKTLSASICATTDRALNIDSAAAWQMFHTASLLLTLSVPCLTESERLATFSRPEIAASALAYSRKTVAISIANRSHVAWVSAVQLLTTGGQCLVEWRERKACARVLEDIQRATGWNTKGNLRELLVAWGWEGYDDGKWKNIGGDLREEQLSMQLLRAWRGGGGGPSGASESPRNAAS